MRAYSSTLTILHLLWPGSQLGEPAGEPVYRRSLRVGPFSTRILPWGGPGFDEEYQPARPYARSTLPIGYFAFGGKCELTPTTTASGMAARLMHSLVSRRTSTRL